jgi:hypothetical protein
MNFLMTHTSSLMDRDVPRGLRRNVRSRLSRKPALSAGVFRESCLVSRHLLNIARGHPSFFHAAPQRSATIGSERRFRCLVTDERCPRAIDPSAANPVFAEQAGIAEQMETARIGAGRM